MPGARTESVRDTFFHDKIDSTDRGARGSKLEKGTGGGDEGGEKGPGIHTLSIIQTVGGREKEKNAGQQQTYIAVVYRELRDSKSRRAGS